MFDLDQAWVDVPCPQCGFETPARIIDMRLEALIWCEGCHVRIALTDGGVSVELGRRAINRATNRVMRSLEELGKRR